MEHPGSLQYIKNCILQFEYPLANSMTDEELADIFKASNRCFLISWMLKLLGTFDEVISTENSQTLSQILYQNGFCTKEQSIPFIVGTLDLTEQFNILERMFIYISTVKKSKASENLQKQPLEDIENLFKNDLNLFPMFGEIKVMETVSNPVNKIEKPRSGNCKATVMRSSDNDMAKLIEDIRIKLPNMKNMVERNAHHLEEGNPICLGPECEDIFKKCHEYIKKINQFIKDVNTIDEFCKNQAVPQQIEHKYSSNNLELLKDVSDVVCDILKYQKKVKICQ